MAPESNEAHKSKNFDQEVKELVSSLTGRLRMINNPQRPGESTTALSQGDNDDNQGVRIITLAGTNVGATMRGESDEKQPGGENHGKALPEQEDFVTCVNSNFQAINNSIMLGGSYESNDPGVHLDIADYVDRHGFPKLKKEGKKQKKGGHGSDHHGGSGSNSEKA